MAKDVIFSLCCIVLFSISSTTSSNAQYVNMDWANKLEGTGRSESKVIKIDHQNNLYILGEYEGKVDFDPQSTTDWHTSSAQRDVYIQKLDKNGNFIWAISLGTVYNNDVYDLECDDKGNIYFLMSYVNKLDCDPDTGKYYLNWGGGEDVAIIKLDSSSRFIWAKSISGAFDQVGNALTFDKSGNIVITGAFQEKVDFDPGPAKFEKIADGTFDYFVLKLDTAGQFVWAKTFGTLYSEFGDDIITDADNNIYITGRFSDDLDFDASNQTRMISAKGGYDVFIHKLDSNGNYLWAKSFGSNNNEYPKRIFLNLEKQIIICGYFEYKTDFSTDTNASITVTPKGVGDHFVINLDSSGINNWLRTFGETGQDVYLNSEQDYNGNIFTLGAFYSSSIDLNPGSDSFKIKRTGQNDAFIQKLDKSGNFIWGRSIEGSGVSNSYTTGIAVDSLNDIYLTGFFETNADLDPDSTKYIFSGAGNTQFVTKWRQCNSTRLYPISQCYSYYDSVRNKTYTSNVTLRDTIPNSMGCDSIIIRKINILKSTSSLLTKSVCDNYVSPSGKIFTSGGKYFDTIPNKAGCDSIITILLNLNKTAYHSYSVDRCNKYVSPSGKVYTNSGIYNDTIKTVWDCDSILTITVNISKSTASSVSATSCFNYTVPSGKRKYTASGVYRDTIPNSEGCDSIITISLTINTVNTTVVKNGNLLTAQATNATYQWLDCNAANKPITNETAQTFLPKINGNYAVGITQNQCVDTSNCLSVVLVGLGEEKTQTAIVYPNPSQGNFRIVCDLIGLTSTIKILDITGREAAYKYQVTNGEVNIESNLGAGIYFVHIQNESHIEIVKVLIR